MQLLTATKTHQLHPPGIFASLKGIWLEFRKEHMVVTITCIYLIFEYNRLQLVYPVIDVIPWGKTLLLWALLLAFADKKSTAPPVAAVLPMASFSVCVIWSMFFARFPSIAFGKWMDFFGWVFVVFLLTSVINTRVRLFLFIAVYFLVNLKMAQHGFISWATEGGFGFSSWGATGSPGWFQNSGEFSMQMAIFLALILSYIAFFRQDWSRSVRLFFYLFTLMVIGSIISCGSRGGMLGLVMVGVWCLAYSRKRIRTLLLLALIGSLIYLVIPPGFKARFETMGDDETSHSRLIYWQLGKKAVRDYPWTGVGFRNWTFWVAEIHPELAGTIGSRNRIEVIHNTYFEAATELGIPGLTAYGIILLTIFLTNNKSRKRARLNNDRFLAATAIGLNGCLMVYMIPSYFMSVLYYPYIWIILALTVCVNGICKKAEPSMDNKYLLTPSLH